MKNRFFVALVALCWALATPPQTANAQHIEWGVRDGVGLSWLAGIDNTVPRDGFYAGIVGNYFFNDNWGLGGDITLSEQGVHCKPNSDNVTMEYHYTYLNIPLLGHYQLSLGGAHTLRFSAGVQMGLFLAGRYNYTAPSILGEGFVSGGEVMDKSSFHPADFGVSLGAQWLVGGFTSIEVRYTLGITQTHNGISTTLNDNYHISVPDNRNSVLQIGTTFLF